MSGVRQTSSDIIETLADSERALARGLAVRREMLSVALTLLHERDCEIGRLRAENLRLRADSRGLRETLLADERRAA